MWWMPVSLRALGELDQRAGEMAGPRRAADLVGHDGDLVALRAEREHRVDEVAAAGAEQPRRAHDRVRGVGRATRALARELRRAVDAERADGVGLEPRLALGAVEDVVGRDVDDQRADLAAAAGDVARARAVDRLGGRAVGLRAVDVGVGRAVDDGVRARRERAPRTAPRRR